MKNVTASEARRTWFRLLDEVAEGAVVCIQRGNRRIVIRREEAPRDGALPDYAELIDAPDLDQADRWGWEWDDAAGDLRSVVPPEDPS